MNDEPRKRTNHAWEYVILACVAAAVMWGLAISRLVRQPGNPPPAPVVAGSEVVASASDLASAVVAMVAGNRPVFVVRAEHRFEEATGCQASLYPALVSRKDAGAEREARREAIASIRDIYDFVASAEAPAGKGHAAVIVGVRC